MQARSDWLLTTLDAYKQGLSTSKAAANLSLFVVEVLLRSSTPLFRQSAHNSHGISSFPFGLLKVAHRVLSHDLSIAPIALLSSLRRNFPRFLAALTAFHHAINSLLHLFSLICACRDRR